MNNDTFTIICDKCEEKTTIENFDQWNRIIGLNVLPGMLIKIKCTNCSSKVIIEKDPLI